MKISHKEIVSEEVEILDDIQCNICLGSLKTPYGYEGLVEISICGGYGSKLGDGAEFQFSVCERCLDKWFDTFKIDPLKNGNER